MDSHSGLSSMEIIHASLAYLENNSPTDISKELFPVADITYQETWANRFSKGLVKAWEKMDYDTRRQYTNLAITWELEQRNN